MTRRPRGPGRGDSAAARLAAHAARLLDEIRRTPKPADYLVAQYFRRVAGVAGAEKAAVVDLVYGTLRLWLYYAELVRAAGFPPARSAHAALYLRLQSSSAGSAPATRRAVVADSGVAAGRFAELVAFAGANAELGFVRDETERLALRRGFQPWVADRLLAAHARGEVEAILDGLSAHPPTCLRANREKTTRDALRERLKCEGIRTRPGRLSADALILREGGDVFGTASFREGHFEVQDEGSQVVSLLVGPRPGARVLDACAGACGKSLHLAAMMRGRGEVFAFDTDARRLANGARRVRRAGLQNVRLLDTPERYAGFAGRFRGGMEAVLVDAPCTGLGTVRRSPDIKLRARPALLEEMNAKQREILDTYAPFVSPGGRLVYATCSVLREENGAVVDDFLARHPEFRLRPAGEAAAALPEGVAGPGLLDALAGSETMQLYPHVHGTDGFFAAVLERA